MEQQYTSQGRTIRWIDLVNPTHDELLSVAARFGLHPAAVQDCLEPEHMPKCEVFGTTTFLIFRAYDGDAPPAAVTTQQLTRKLALFAGPDWLISIHRVDLPFVARLRSGRQVPVDSRLLIPDLIHGLVKGVLDSYDGPLNGLHGKLTAIETATFAGDDPDKVLRDGYVLRRQATVIRHMMVLTDELLADLPAAGEVAAPLIRDLTDKCGRLRFYADDLQENINSVLHLHLSLASHRTNQASYKTNEVMRLLTVFSAFFLPLNFIAGVYGMNFDQMPELHWRFGYFATLSLMGTVAVGIFWWFRRRGWLKNE